MKKLLALLCAVMLLVTFSIPVFAEGGTGTITIDNAVEGKTYKIYKMLDLTKNGDIHSYTVATGWEEFFTTAGAAYVNIVDGIVTWKGEDANRVEEAAALAVAAMAYVEAKSIAAVDTKTYADDGDETKNEVGSVQFTDLALGYYLVDSNLGAICSITTTSPNATIIEKNTVPSVDKVIVEDGNELGATTAKIGDTVNFKSTITAYKGLENLTWYDKMSNSLTYKNDVVITAGVSTLTQGTDYTLESVSEFTLVVKFTDTYLASLLTKDTGTGIEIKITYSATLNENAVIGDAGNPNIVHITYGDDNSFESEEVQVVVKTYSFDLVKTDSNNKLLAGAGFKLYTDEKCENEIKLVKIDDNTYRVAMEGETGVEIMTNANSPITVKGLENGTYYLKETTTPANYNPLSAPQAVEITNANNSTSMDDTTWETGDGGVHIINNSGNVLPETGGIGTTLFIAIGSIVVLISGVVLVARKRMAKFVA